MTCGNVPHGVGTASAAIPPMHAELGRYAPDQVLKRHVQLSATATTVRLASARVAQQEHLDLTLAQRVARLALTAMVLLALSALFALQIRATFQ